MVVPSNNIVKYEQVCEIEKIKILDGHKGSGPLRASHIKKKKKSLQGMPQKHSVSFSLLFIELLLILKHNYYANC